MHANTDHQVEVAIIGAGIAGIATAYSLCRDYKKASLLLIDPRQPMSYTTAQSGDNYRNWWPHPTMAAFADDSIERMRAIAAATDNVFNMTDRGYVLATRQRDIAHLLAELPAGVEVDICRGKKNTGTAYPALSPEIANVLHTRTGGDISGQQLGQYMLDRVRNAGGKQLRGAVCTIDGDGPFRLQVRQGTERTTVAADIVVNAAGPFVQSVAAMLGLELPVKNVFQQKIAFEDTIAAIPRDMPFTIDLDRKTLRWSDEERQLLASDAELEWLTKPMPPGTHCRPEGSGQWVKLGWAYNERVSEPQQDLANEPAIDPQFPEIVIRGAAALIPSLEPYIDAPPTRFTQYGGYYTMTDENWPLIGPMGTDGAFVVGALSGFGSMMACAAGAVCAAWISGGSLPEYAASLSLARYDDADLLSELQASSNKGLL